MITFEYKLINRTFRFPFKDIERESNKSTIISSYYTLIFIRVFIPLNDRYRCFFSFSVKSLINDRF